MPPFGGAGLADGVLVAEETDLVEGVGGVYGVEPPHAHKVFGLLRVIGGGAVEGDKSLSVWLYQVPPPPLM